MQNQGFRQVWAGSREQFAPSFRAEIDDLCSYLGGSSEEAEYPVGSHTEMNRTGWIVAHRGHRGSRSSR